MVWAGFSETVRLPLVILETTLNSDVYMDMLKKHVIPFLEKNKVLDKIIFQQDGATPHTSERVLEFLKDSFKAGIISNKSEIQWPPSSPDLSPLDFFLWGYLRDLVYSSPKPKTLPELKEKLINCYESIPKSMFRNAIHSVSKRVKLCLDADGKHFENYVI